MAISINGTSKNKKSRKRRRAHEPTGLNTEPYQKKQKPLGQTFYHYFTFYEPTLKHKQMFQDSCKTMFFG